MGLVLSKRDPTELPSLFHHVRETWGGLRPARQPSPDHAGTLISNFQNCVKYLCIVYKPCNRNRLRQRDCRVKQSNLLESIQVKRDIAIGPQLFCPFCEIHEQLPQRADDKSRAYQVVSEIPYLPSLALLLWFCRCVGSQSFVCRPQTF